MKVFGGERRDITDSATGKRSFGNDVLLLKVQGPNLSLGRDLMFTDSARGKGFVWVRRDVTL